MSAETCPYDFPVTEAARSGEWSESLRAHVCDCRECAESVRVIEWMAGVATQLGRDQPAPDPTFIWLKAEIERRAEEEAVPVSRRRLGALGLLSLTLGLAGASAVLAIWPEVSSAVGAARTWVLTMSATTSPADVTVIATAWLGLPLLLAATYLLVLRPR
jgi:hypothetical protein